MLKKLCLLFGAATLAASVGCIANHKYGCENTSLANVGGKEGLVFQQHGCPDQIIEIGNPKGMTVKHWNKYLVVYRIGEGHMLLGNIMQSDKFNNIAYLIDNGKIINCGYVSEGEGSSILMPLADAMHPKARVGYGGDYGYPGSYGTATAPSNAGLTVNIGR